MCQNKNKISLSIFKKFKYNFIKSYIKEIINLICNCCELVGSYKISNIINILLKKNEFNIIQTNNDKYNNVIKYYDKYFISYNSKIIQNDDILLNISSKLPFLKKWNQKVN